MNDHPAEGVTGERLIPSEQHGELVHAEHLARYRFAAQLAFGKRVLDAACGEGYGTELLREAGAAQAVGVDIDAPTIEAARRRYQAEFEVAEVTRLPFEDGAFDLAVSFETIEHVDDPEAVVRELARVLGPAGTLVVSTPNAREYTVENEFHVRELDPEEFLAMLRRHFPHVRPLYQQNWLTSAVLDEPALRERSGERPIEAQLLKVAGVEPGRELYTLALCGAGADSPPRQVAVLSGVHEAHALARRLVDAERTAARWHDAFQETQRHLRELAGSLSWRLTRPLRVGKRLRRRGR